MLFWEQCKLWNGNYKLKTGTLAQKPQKNHKNSAQNEKCVFWNDVFFLGVNFATVLKNGSDYEIFYEIFLQNIASERKCWYWNNDFFF